jgi:CheY-like chemotaxis protein
MHNENGSDTSSPLVLVVDDDPDVREMCMITLRIAGLRAEQAADGAIALDMALAVAPDVILLDDSMPVMSGPEVAQRLRGDARTRETPIVMLTGFSDGTERGRKVRASGGCDMYLEKPCDAELLVSALRAVMRTSALRFARAGTVSKARSL